jgi:hypothetical protein
MIFISRHSCFSSASSCFQKVVEEGDFPEPKGPRRRILPIYCSFQVTADLSEVWLGHIPQIAKCKSNIGLSLTLN